MNFLARLRYLIFGILGMFGFILAINLFAIATIIVSPFLILLGKIPTKDLS